MAAPTGTSDPQTPPVTPLMLTGTSITGGERKQSKQVKFEQLEKEIKTRT